MRHPAIIACLLLGLSGCATVEVYRRSFPQAPSLAAQFSPEKPVLVSQVQEAYFDGRRFCVRLRYRQTEIFSEAAVPPELVGDRSRPDGPPVLPILPLEDHREASWADPPAPADSLRIMPLEDWGAIKQQIMDVITPRDGHSGVVVDYLDEAEYFLYRNEQGDINYVFLQDKPPGYRIRRTYDIEEMIRIGLSRIERFLDERKIASRRILFQTGDKELFAFPMVLVDLPRETVLFVQFLPGSPERVVLFHDQYLEAAAQVFASHLGVLFRPVSSLGRLLFMATDTAAESARWTWVGHLGGEPIPPVGAGRPMDIPSFESALDSLSIQGRTSGRVDVLVDGGEFFPRLVDAMNEARRSIDLRVFIFDNDDYALKIADVLKKRSKENVKVRVLADGLGSIAASRSEPSHRPRAAGVPPSIGRYLREGSKVDVRFQDNPWFMADHAKTITIDGNTGFLGGMNIGREYRYEWHDAMFEVEGPVVGILEREFSRMWAQAGFWGDFGVLFSRSKAAAWTTDGTEFPMRVLLTKTGRSEIFIAQMEAARRANSRIYVQNAYLADDAILFELAKARRRGVDVRVILPLKGDSGIMNRSNALAVNAMLRCGIRVYLYPGMSHVKAAVYDGWACIGSANFDRASLKHNRELDIATSHGPTVERITQRLFTEDFERSIEVHKPFPEEWYDRLLEILADQV